jgi:hypothetical protein
LINIINCHHRSFFGGVKIVKEISLTGDKFTLVDDEDFEYLNQFNWFADKHRTKIRDVFNVKTNINRKIVLMHRLIMNPKKDLIVDHINGDNLDNRKTNLRIVTHRQNDQNKHYKRTSKYPGVNWSKQNKKWLAQIWIDGKNKYLGSFISEKKAFKAYKKAVHELIGEKLVCET